MTDKQEKKQAWAFAEGLIKIDKLETSDDMKKLIEKEINGEITTDDIIKTLNKKYRILGNDSDG